MIRNLKFRWKLALLVAVPLLALLVTTTLGVTRRLELVREQHDALELEKPAATLTDVIKAVQTEHALSMWYLAVPDPAVLQQLGTARAATDAAIAALPAAIRQAADSGALDAARRMRDVGVLVSSPTSERKRVNQRSITGPELLDYYGGASRTAVESLENLGRGSKDAKSAANLRDYATVAKIANAAGNERAILLGAFASAQLPTNLANDAVAAAATQEADKATFLAQADDDLRQVFAASTEEFRAASDQVQLQRTAAQAGRLTQIAPSAWNTTATSQVDGWFRTAAAVRAKTHRIEADRIADARKQAWLYVGGMVLVFLLAIGIAIAIGRAITRPLRRLTRAARDVSERELPHLVDTLQREDDEAIPDVAPIPVESRDEIGELAGAFNTIEDTAVTVARDQRRVLRKGIGDLYVSLARRNQSLLERQLKVIDELEVDEADPEKLDALFRLDHLATRMRRNAESLLVIAGVETVRPHTEPVPLREVIRGALSEIADYARVDVVSIPEDVTVHGNVAVDLTHVLAELLENATSFSRPSTRVFVGGDREESGFTITISDEGIGIPADRVDSANNLLTNPPLPGLSLARSLGLVVVSRLAARIGVRVELRSAPDVGTSALVELPARVLASGPVVPATPMSRRGAPAAFASPTLASPEVTSPPMPAEPQPVPAAASNRAPSNGTPSETPAADTLPISLFTPAAEDTVVPEPLLPPITPQTPAPAATPGVTRFSPVGGTADRGEDRRAAGRSDAEPDAEPDADSMPRPDRIALERSRRRRVRGRRREPTPKPKAVPIPAVVPTAVGNGNGSGEAEVRAPAPNAAPDVTAAGLPIRTTAPPDVIDLRHEDAPLAPSSRPPDEVFELIARFEAGRRRVTPESTSSTEPTEPAE